MKEARDNMSNAYFNKNNGNASIQEDVEHHYQVIKHLRSQQWRLEKEAISTTTSPWWSLRSVAIRVNHEEIKQLDTVLDRYFMLLLGRCLQVELFG